MGLYVPRRAHLPRGGPVCTGGLDVIRKEAWSFYRTISGVRLRWDLEEPEGPKNVRPEAGLSVPRRAYRSRGGPVRLL